MRGRKGFHLGIVLLAVTQACGPRAPAQPAAAITDDFGATVTIGSAPSRIVSLNPTTTEILFAIGAGARLVGRSQYDVFPDAARNVTSLGLAPRPNLQA